MSKGLSIHDGTGICIKDPAHGILLQYGTTVPGAVSGFAPGCRFIKVNATTIGTVEYVNVGTKLAANFVAASLAAAISVNFVYGEATPLDGAFFVADRPYVIQSIIARILVAGTDAGAVTAQVRKAANTAAIGAGVVMHSGTINLKGAVDTNQTMTLLTGVAITVQAGTGIGLDVTGVTTAARGVISMLLLPG